jgi:hypothetical protein
MLLSYVDAPVPIDKLKIVKNHAFTDDVRAAPKILATNEVGSKELSGAPEKRIKVIPEMVEAAVEEYCRWNGEMESGLISLEELVKMVLDVGQEFS